MSQADDAVVVREFIQRELETINAYHAMILRASDVAVRRMLAHAMDEEKEHVAEGLALLGRLDAQQAAVLATDHTPHFADGGKGDLSLRGFEAARGESTTTSRLPEATQLPGPPPPADTLPPAETPPAAMPALGAGVSAELGDAARVVHPVTARGFDESSLTVGSLRGARLTNDEA